MSEMLEKARKYEFIQGQQIKEEERPAFHITPYVGWMNDPNGLIFSNQKYHIFYQYNPFGNAWGHMSWGHAVSVDLLHWKTLPVALLEENGIMIFSGSAIHDNENNLCLIYTGFQDETLIQDINLAFSQDQKGKK